MTRLLLAAVLAVATWLVPEIASSAEICRECYIWQKSKSGYDVAKVWCCFNVRYEVRGSGADQEIAHIRKMLASLSGSTSLTFNEVSQGGDLIIITGLNAYEYALESADTDPEVSKFNNAVPHGLLNGLLNTAILNKSPCSVSELEDDTSTVRAAIIITSNPAVCLEKSIESTFGLHNPIDVASDATALCILYGSYRRFTRSYGDINQLIQNSAVTCG